LLDSRSLKGPNEGPLLVQLAGAEGIVGNHEASRRSINQAVTVARSLSKLELPYDALDGTLVAAVYARLGESDTAVRWLEATLPQYASVRGLLLDPRLSLLRGTPAFERFLKAHPE